MAAKKKKTPTPLGRRIQQIVDERDILKKDFAEAIGVSPGYVYQLVGGHKKNISPSLAKLIETLYGYPAGWVLNGERGDGLTGHTGEAGE